MNDLSYLKSVLDHLAQVSNERPAVKATEILLTIHYLESGAQEPVTLSQPELAAALGAHVTTVGRLTSALKASGRWEIVGGAGRSETTFQPLFLDSVALPAVDGGK